MLEARYSTDFFSQIHISPVVQNCTKYFLMIAENWLLNES